jgi:hypothetical protein
MEVDLTIEILGSYTTSGTSLIASNATVVGDIHLRGTAVDHYQGQTTIASTESDISVTLARGPSEFYLEADAATGEVKALWVLLAAGGSFNQATAIAIEWLPTIDGVNNFFIKIKLPTRNFDWEFEKDGRDWYKLTGKVIYSTFDISPYRIGPDKRWIKSSTDQTALGLWRTQYLPDQTFRPGFSIIAGENIVVKVVVQLSRIEAFPNTGKIRWPVTKTVEFSPLTLQEGVSRRIYFPIVADEDMPFGYYEIRAYLESVANPGRILDTTEPGMVQTMPGHNDAWIDVPVAEGGWLPYPLHQGIQKCRSEPVILLHGFTGRTTDFGDLEIILTREHNFAVRSFDFHALTDAVLEEASVRNIAAVFGGIPSRSFTTIGGVTKGSNEVNYENSIAWVKEYYGAPLVDLVVHSMGGLVSGTYVAGQAATGVNNTASYPYRDDVNRIVTLATPFYGPNDEVGGFIPFDPSVGLIFPPILNFKFHNDPPLVQIHDMFLGSTMMWLLHKNLTFSNYLNIGGVLETSTPSLDNYNDEIVPLPSSMAKTVIGVKRFFRNCRHTATNPANMPVAHITYGNYLTHGPYKLLTSYLKGESLPSDGFLPETSSAKFESFPHVVKVTDPVGNEVRARVSAYGSLFEYGYWRNFSGLHARTRVPLKGPLNGPINQLRVTPTGLDALYYQPATLTLDGEAGQLMTTEVTLGGTGDSDGDGLPDYYELKYSGSTTGFSPTADNDGDGLSNRWELFLGTDPTSGQPNVRIAETVISTPNAAAFSAKPPPGPISKFTFVADTAPGVLYQIQEASAPGGPWRDVGVAVEGVGFPVQFSAEIAAGTVAMFYRLEMSLMQ